MRYFGRFQIPVELIKQNQIHELASKNGLAPKYFSSDMRTFTSEEFIVNNNLKEHELDNSKLLRRDIAELVCKFNNHKDIMKHFIGRKRANRVTAEDMYDQIENVKFITDNEKGLYWTFLRDIKPVFDEISPHLKTRYPILR